MQIQRTESATKTRLLDTIEKMFRYVDPIKSECQEVRTMLDRVREHATKENQTRSVVPVKRARVDYAAMATNSNKKTVNLLFEGLSMLVDGIGNFIETIEEDLVVLCMDVAMDENL